MTRKFIPGREENPNFHLGLILLRSARSIPDVSALVLGDVVRAATVTDPLTAGTSSGIPPFGTRYHHLGPGYHHLGPGTVQWCRYSTVQGWLRYSTVVPVQYSGGYGTVQYSGAGAVQRWLQCSTVCRCSTAVATVQYSGIPSTRTHTTGHHQGTHHARHTPYTGYPPTVSPHRVPVPTSLRYHSVPLFPDKNVNFPKISVCGVLGIVPVSVIPGYCHCAWLTVPAHCTAILAHCTAILAHYTAILVPNPEIRVLLVS